MYKLSRSLILAIPLLAVLLGMAGGTGKLEVYLDNLTSMRLPAPQDPMQRQYLGLSTADDFTLIQVKAQAVIVEIFSMYCPHCQASAPEVNRLNEAIEKDPATKGRVKLIGIGAGNTPVEVAVFRKKYGIEFPLLADDGFHVQKAFAKPLRTPTIMVLKLDGSGKAVLVHSHVGELKDREELLKVLAGLLGER
jgi:peroxiredoxin